MLSERASKIKAWNCKQMVVFKSERRAFVKFSSFILFFIFFWLLVFIFFKKETYWENVWERSETDCHTFRPQLALFQIWIRQNWQPNDGTLSNMWANWEKKLMFEETQWGTHGLPQRVYASCSLASGALPVRNVATPPKLENIRNFTREGVIPCAELDAVTPTTYNLTLSCGTYLVIFRCYDDFTASRNFRQQTNVNHDAAGIQSFH